MLDPESGLYYYGARYYDPELGRFISPDPFVGQPDDPQNLNRYSYVVNNPVNGIDPDGNFHIVKKKKKKGGFFRSFFGFFIGAIVTALTGNPFLGGFVGGAVNAGLNGGNPFLGGIIGGVTAGITAGLLGDLSPPGSDFGSLSPALIGTHVGVAASGLSPPAGIQLAEASSGPGLVLSDASAGFRFAPGSDEPGLEGPLFDPIDLIGLGAGIFKITKGLGQAVISRVPVNITLKGLVHTLKRHTVGGIETANKSVFTVGDDLVVNLIRRSETAREVLTQSNGNIARIAEAGRVIGIDRVTGQPTSTYTVITDAAGNLITSFPGRP